LSGVAARITALNAILQSTGTIVAAVGIGLAVGFTVATLAAIKQAIRFETALVEVAKTTGLAGESLAELGLGLREIAIATGLGAQKTAALAIAAGQLGIKGVANIEAFTLALAKLEIASDVAGEQGARQFARLLNITGAASTEAEKFASVLVELGNNSAATEKEILKMSTQIAQSTSAFGLSTEAVLALGAAAASLGLRAESTASSFGRFFRSVTNAVAEGGAELRTFAELMRISTNEVRRLLEEEPEVAFIKFATGINLLSGESSTLSAILKSLSLSGEENIRVFTSLAKRIEIANEALRLSNEEADEATAINRELEARLDSVAGQWGILVARIQSAAIAYGDQFVPAIKDALKFINELFDPTSKLSTENERLSKSLRSVFDIVKAMSVFGPLGIIAPFIPDAEDLLGGGSAEAEKLRKELEGQRLRRRREAEALGDPGFVDPSQIDVTVGGGESAADQRAAKAAAKRIRDAEVAARKARDNFQKQRDEQAAATAQIDQQVRIIRARTVATQAGKQALEDFNTQIDIQQQAEKAVSDIARTRGETQENFLQRRDALQAEVLQALLDEERAIRAIDKAQQDLTKTVKRYKEAQEKAKNEIAKAEQIGRRFGNVLGNAMEVAIFSGESLRNVFAGLLKDMALLIFRLTVIEPLINAIATGFGNAQTTKGGKAGLFGIVGSIVGGLFGGGGGGGGLGDAASINIPGGGFRFGGIVGRGGQRIPFQSFADGGVVGDSTARIGKFHVGETIRTPEQEASLRGGGDKFNFTINTGVAQTVRAELLSLMPMIVRVTSEATADRVARGGGLSKRMREGIA